MKKLKFKDPGPPLEFTRPQTKWEPKPLPELRDDEEISLDFEYEANDDPTKIKPIGYAAYSPGRREGWYVPFAHRGGGNIDTERARSWLAGALTGNRRVHGLATKFEVHCARNLGLNVDSAKWHDCAFNAALLNENRRSGFSLEALAEEYLPLDERKQHPETIDEKHFYLSHASEVADRCISDAYLAWRVHEVTSEQIGKEDLDRVLKVENQCILPVVEMERNGARLDRSKLDRWYFEVGQRTSDLAMSISQQNGLSAFNPNADKSMVALFSKLGLEQPIAYDEKERRYKPSWSDDALATVNHPEVDRARKLRKLLNLKSKYLEKYLHAMDSNNVARFNLHQLRGDENGTVTGRFSCGGGENKYNVQQVMKCESQIEEMGDEFVIRELYIPDDGRVMGASDASQIEFRLFGHYSGSEFIVDAYRDDPMVDFHMMVTRLMNPHVKDDKTLKGLRKHMKHNNFGVLYGMGRLKLARKLGYACTCDRDWSLSELIDGRWYRVNHFEDNFEHFDGCPACTANNIMDEYEEKFPQARQLLRKASNLARDRGYVHTLLGRRRRYPEAKRLHSALNAIIQGSAADYFKLKLIELYNEREFLGIKLRMPVHDEFVYDCNDDDRAKRSIQELLDTQSLSLCVPLLWESGFGKNWREANMGGPPLTDDQGWMRQSNAGEGKSPYPNPTPEEKSTRSEIGDQHGPV